MEAELLRAWSHRTVARGDLLNDLRSLYSLVGDARDAQQKLQRDILVNDTRVLVTRFDQATSDLTFLDARLRPLLTVSYDAAGMPLVFAPRAPGAAPLRLTYDRFNRPDGWQWGRDRVSVTRDRRGLPARTENAADGAVSVDYDEAGLAANVTLASGRSFRYVYDADGGLAQVVLPSGTNHTFGAQPSLGFVRVTYAPPGGSHYVQHFSAAGLPLLTVFPGDGARVAYRYDAPDRLAEVVHGDGHTQFTYGDATGLATSVAHSDRDVDYRCDYGYSGGLLTEERLEYGAKTGLSNAKLLYEYDSNFRLVSVQGRIGGQTLASYRISYDAVTGAPDLLGSFSVSRPAWNESVVSDGTAAFSRVLDERFQPTRVTVTIHAVEVYRTELEYDARGRVARTRTHTRTAGADAYSNSKNYTWDRDGRLSGVEAQEPWRFSYDDNGNLLALAYRGNTIPMQYDERDRIVKFGEGQYRYDARGHVVQNAREERFQYGAKGLLARATKRGRFDVRYHYDHRERLSTRKDNFGNVTQFFYADPQRPDRLTHLYSPRDNRFMSLVYDNVGHLIYAQVARHKYYVATDQCGTPVMVFNQYGEGIREMMRSPYGHIVYDSNPYLYLPVDFCGGVLDPATSLVHMPGGGVYDPLIGQWMSPRWERVLERAADPARLHLYRFNGNDPLNPPRDHPPRDEASWLRLLGYDVSSLAPQLSPRPRTPHTASAHPAFALRSAFLAYEAERRPGLAPRPPSPALAADPPRSPPRRAAADPPLGRGIVVSRSDSGRALVTASPAANAIYRDVYTSVLNGSHLLPFTLSVHADRQDVFYFVKEEAWRAADDAQQLKRLQGKVNVSFHEESDVRIHAAGAVLNVRYGTTPERERARLLHHARLLAARRAWQREQELLRAGLGSRDWSAAELDEIAQAGAAAGYEPEYAHDPARYPELAEDPYNVRLVRRRAERSARRRLKPHAAS